MTWKEILEKQKSAAQPEIVGDEQKPVDRIAMMRERELEIREARRRQTETPPPVRWIKVHEKSPERPGPMPPAAPRVISVGVKKPTEEERTFTVEVTRIETPQEERTVSVVVETPETKNTKKRKKKAAKKGSAK